MRTLKKIKLRQLWSLEILSFIHKNPGSSIREVADGLGISYQTAQRYLRELRGQGKLIVKLGSKNNIQRFYPNCSVKLDDILSGLERTMKEVFKEEDI
jgi:predicted transcriptional regulator